MKPILLKKTTNEDNLLGWNTIELIDKCLFRALDVNDLPYGDDLSLRVKGTIYEYMYLAVCDGELCEISEADLRATHTMKRKKYWNKFSKKTLAI